MTGAKLAASGRREGGKLVFVVTEDWFFVSHFLPMARAAIALGLDVVVVTRVRDHAAPITATGARLLALDAERSSLNPFKAISALLQLKRMLRAEQPDIVHCIALRSILIGGLAARLAGVHARVYALTGLGFLGARGGFVAGMARGLVKQLLTGPLAGKGAQFLFENPDDPAMLGLDANDEQRVTIVGGAGIDPDVFCPAPLPADKSLKVAVVARMLWSKGIDLAVAAVRTARAASVDVELSLYGAPDPANPKAVPEATLRAWNDEPGITWHGPTHDVASVWAAHHVACLPSRGGEGLPRTLLEAAACGRALLTTDVPGCRALVRDGVEGYVVPAGNVNALVRALIDLANAPDQVAAMGAAARERVLNGYTERDVMAAVSALYQRCLADPAGGR
jgi:glycosyltransferase involved in cell wall biosynthesis